MDTLDKYKKIIEDILTEYVKIPYAYGQLETKLIIDRTATNYNSNDFRMARGRTGSWLYYSY